MKGLQSLSDFSGSSAQKDGTSDGRVLAVGVSIVVLVFLVFGIWSAVAPLDSAALAQGVVKVKGNRKQVQHYEGGIVDRILIQEGQEVSQGDLLMRLDDTQARAESQILTSQLLTAKVESARFLAELTGAEEPEFPEIPEQDGRGAEARKASYEHFLARRVARLGEAEVLQQQTEQLKLQAGGLKELIGAKNRLVTSFDEEIAQYDALYARGLSNNLRIRELQRQRDEYLGEIAEHQSEIASTNVRVTEAGLKIIQIERNAKTEAANELSRIKSEIYDLEERLYVVEDRIRKASIRAPVEGMVMGLSVYTVGGVIRPGDVLMELVPKDADLVIEARISPSDIDSVAVGMIADLRFPGFNTASTPIVQGQLVDLSADSFVNEEDGSAYYIGKLLAETESLERQLGRFSLVPGMPVEVVIKTGSRTLFEYLAKPALNVLDTSLLEH
ncbi:HlyD family type I secretion periplasmic adaptor subunit [Marinobacter sp. LV10MA510-1]|uniref:HlyD family type I secretion periplasmic adaptor subunit n=1 Tax=Marinobacter sp. LV10MA510-1 TaxID=1415567 RepID=UPI000BF92BCB|nr:HlyD family type I secretion periplasmic adaptor subunit [Marinobacter sp. LV10MA510-1]PFG08964.1 epimerase transport system membrane fusion protein [Marinobacter sp. LV10MA510-1]